MEVVLTVLCLFLATGSCVVYIESVTSDFNPKFLDFKVAYIHNSKGDCVVNVTFATCVTVTKLLLYAKLSVPENKDDREYRMELVRTVFDLEKLFKGSQTNFLVNVFYNSVSKYMDFELKLPLAPGTYRFINVIVDSTYIPFPQDLPGTVGMRAVVKSPSYPKLQFFAEASFRGGFKRT